MRAKYKKSPLKSNTMFSVIDLSQDRCEISPYISSTLLDGIEMSLSRWEKTILYLNKRGSYSSLVCQDCHYLFECVNCDSSLCVHQHPHHLKCHMCQSSFSLPLSCPKCQGNNLENIGVGTQQIEDVLRKYFSHDTHRFLNNESHDWKTQLSAWRHAPIIYRFDSDNIKTISEKRSAIQDLKNADIIIGTKMITTGFDFEKIWCIGVILAESELQHPSYNAFEKAYSNLRQLVGRWNRKGQKTDIIFQSFIPKNTLISYLVEWNFKDFLSYMLQERKDFIYPPFWEYVKIEYRSKESQKSLAFLKKLETTLKEYAHDDIQFLAGTSCQKRNNQYHASLIIKWPRLRELLENIRPLILREWRLSIAFNS